MTNFEQLVQDLGHPAVPWEIAALLGCLAGAYALCWVLGRHRTEQSIWFGRFIVDGVLFPLLALAFVYAAFLYFATRQPAGVLRIALPVLVSLAVIRFLARVLTVVLPNSAFARLMERVFSWLAWIAAVLWIIGVLPSVIERMGEIEFALGKARISLLAVVQGALSVCAVMVLTLWISAAVERKVLTQTVHDLSLRKVAANAIRAALIGLGLLMALSSVGVDLTALSVLGGAIGVGIGFGLQKLAANYVSGFVILFERSMRIGDTVKVDSFEGVVTDIKTRYTLIRAANGREAIVPNEKVITERVENMSRADQRIVLTTTVTVGYDSDVDQVQRILRDAALGSPRVMQDPEPIIQLAQLAPDGLEFTLVFFTQEPVTQQANVKSDVNIRLLRGLREAGVDIPYPQRVVHLMRAPARTPASTS